MNVWIRGRWFHVDITSKRQKENIDKLPRRFDELFRRNFDRRKFDVSSKCFVRCHFNRQKINVISIYFLQRKFLCRFNVFFLTQFQWIYKNSGMIHFAEVNQAPFPYSMLQHICSVATPKLVPRKCLRYLQTTLIMRGGRLVSGFMWGII